MRHFNLRALTLCGGILSATLVLPSLESLSLCSWLFNMQLLEDLNFMCPKLKKVKIERLRRLANVDGDRSSSRFSYKSVEELHLDNFLLSPTHIICPKLDKLVLRWFEDKVGEPSFELDCSLVTTLGTVGYHTKSCLSAIFSKLPSLKFLYISDATFESGELVLEHSSIEGIEVAHSNVESLRLVRPCWYEFA